jgi:hypothetical protein
MSAEALTITSVGCVYESGFTDGVDRDREAMVDKTREAGGEYDAGGKYVGSI